MRNSKTIQSKRPYHELAIACTITFAVLSGNTLAETKDEQDDPPFTLGISYDATSGKYGTASKLRTKTTSLDLQWYASDEWSLSADVPYFTQDTPITVNGNTVSVVKVGNKLVPVTNLTSQTVIDARSGLGDVNTQVSRTFDSGSGPVLSLSARAKLPTASSSQGLGTGKTDYGVLAGVANVMGPWTVSTDLGYTLVGQVTGVGLKNYTFYDLSAIYKIDEKWGLGAVFAGSTSAVVGSPPTSTFSLSSSYKFGNNAYANLNLLKGYTTSSPDWGLGLTVSVGF